MLSSGLFRDVFRGMSIAPTTWRSLQGLQHSCLVSKIWSLWLLPLTTWELIIFQPIWEHFDCIQSKWNPFHSRARRFKPTFFYNIYNTNTFGSNRTYLPIAVVCKRSIRTNFSLLLCRTISFLPFFCFSSSSIFYAFSIKKI